MWAQHLGADACRRLQNRLVASSIIPYVVGRSYLCAMHNPIVNINGKYNGIEPAGRASERTFRQVSDLFT